MDPARCHNKRQMRSRCTACQDICPQGLYPKPGFVPRFTACVRCGLCVSACATRCISPAPDALEAQAALLKRPEGPVWLGCDAAARQNDQSVHCLAALPWEYLAALSLRGPVVLDISPCAHCEREAAAALLRQNLERLVVFWGAEAFGQRIRLDDSGAPVPEHGATTRRGLLRSALAQGQKGLGKLAAQLPGTAQQPGEGLVYRGLLHQEMQAHPGSYGWRVPPSNAGAAASVSASAPRRRCGSPRSRREGWRCSCPRPGVPAAGCAPSSARTRPSPAQPSPSCPI